MDFRKWHSYALFIFLFTANSQAISAPNAPDQHKQISPIITSFMEMVKSSWVATASLGPGWESAGSTQIFFLTPGIEKSYVANHATHSFVNGELFLGIQQTLQQHIQGQIGLELAHTGNANLSGHIWDDANSAFNNYTYKYDIEHTHIALKGKLLGDWGWPVQPWISTAMGVGFNKSYNFSNASITFEAVPVPNFVSNTVSTFTYTIGIGVEREWQKHWKAGLGYEFADWGQSQLGTAQGQTLNSGLSLSHLYTSSVLLNLTYQS